MRLLLALCLLGAPLGAAAQEDVDAGILEESMLDERALQGLEQASGFIVDRTITQFGGEFMRVFSQTWRALPGTQEFDVTIIERPTARYGSLVWIEYNNRPIARAFLYAGRSTAIRSIAVAAAEYVANKLADEALASMLFEDPDLAKGGF
jgi:curli production assembly/transport component CsgE